MEPGNEGNQNKPVKKVGRAGNNPAAAVQKAGKRAGQKIRDTNGRQLTPAEVRRYKKRITNRESARKMRQQRKDEWVTLNKEADSLREENATLLSESRFLLEHASSLHGRVDRLEKLLLHAIDDTQHIKSDALSWKNMLQERVRRLPTVSAVNVAPNCAEEYGSEAGLGPPCFEEYGTDDSQAEDADMDECKDPTLIKFSLSSSRGRGGSVKPEMSPPCTSLLAEEVKLSSGGGAAGSSPSPPATPPNEHCVSTKPTRATTLPPFLDDTLHIGNTGLFSHDNLPLDIGYPATILRPQLSMQNMPGGAQQPRSCSTGNLAMYSKQYAPGMHAVSGLPELLEPTLDFHPDMFDDLEFLPDALGSDIGHPLPLQQA